jgi:SAM-dependent methyltransferase
MQLAAPRVLALTPHSNSFAETKIALAKNSQHKELVTIERQAVNPFNDPALAIRYEGWYAAAGLEADILEKALLGKLLRCLPNVHTVLEVGCGTGHFTRWMAERGLEAVGLDISEPMLDEARRLGGPKYLLGDALSLPVLAQSYDVVALITTLEFLNDPARALAEAVRVARHGVLLGVLNRWSLLTLRYRLSGKALWRSARFFGPRDLARLGRQAAGGRGMSIAWRTTLWPISGVGDLPLPWGGFIGMLIQLDKEERI